jgi:hypothetical protein
MAEAEQQAIFREQQGYLQHIETARLKKIFRRFKKRHVAHSL